jgi:hypothetical protein
MLVIFKGSFILAIDALRLAKGTESKALAMSKEATHIGLFKLLAVLIARSLWREVPCALIWEASEVCFRKNVVGADYFCQSIVNYFRKNFPCRFKKGYWSSVSNIVRPDYFFRK